MEETSATDDDNSQSRPKRGLRRLGLGSSKRKLSFNSRVMHLSDDDDSDTESSEKQQPERRVHFSAASDHDCREPPAELTVQTRVFEREWDETDKALLWWTPEEMATMSEETATICRFHRGEEDVDASGHQSSCSDDNASSRTPSTTHQRLQAMWNMCVKSAVKSRTTGAAANARSTTTTTGRRRSSGRDSLTSSIQPIDVHALWMEDSEQHQTTTLINQEARGLEPGILSVLHTKRRQMLEGVLNAQTNLSKSTHPAMRERIVSRTAAHLARASATFAKALGDQDELVALAQYAANDNGEDNNIDTWSQVQCNVAPVAGERQ